MAGLLSKERIIARPGFNRWLVPPAALSIHLAIGQVYAFSVFKIPLSRAIGITESAPGDWKLSTIGWIFSTAIVFLGLSAAAFGTWLERVGPRRAMFTSALCFSTWYHFVSSISKKRSCIIFWCCGLMRLQARCESTTARFEVIDLAQPSGT